MKEIQKISVTDAVVESIREMIEEEKYAPGEKLPTESSFCESLKVSRTSVREALRVLQTLGIVEIRPGKGAFVASTRSRLSEKNWYNVDSAKFYDFMEVRLAIESLSVRLSVQRATDEQIMELEEVHQAFVETTAHKDMARMIMLDELFHSKIVEFTNNQLLININSQLLDSFRVYRGCSFTNKEVYQNAVEPHARILQCFHDRDVSGAVAELVRHLEITTRDMELIHKNASAETPQHSGESVRSQIIG